MSKNKPSLKKELGLKDLILFNIACVIGLSSLTQAAQFGWSSILLWLVAAICFLLPIALVVIELGKRVGGMGGFYAWTKSALGSKHAFIAAWSYWMSNLVWFPTVLFTIVYSSYFIYSDSVPEQNDSILPTIIALLVLWFIVLLNIYGLKFAKWIQNVGAIALWLLLILITVSAFVYINKHEITTPTIKMLMPDLSDFRILPFFAAICFSFGGLELSSVMYAEIKNPAKNLTRSVLYSSFFILIFYIFLTLILIVTNPDGNLDIVYGIAQTFHKIDLAISWPFLGSIGALLVTLSTVGLFSSWLTGSARLPFAIGLDNYLPSFLGKVHSKYKSPYWSLIVQAIIISILFILSKLGSQIQEAYSVLYDMSVILYFIPFLYIFISFIIHLKKNTSGISAFRFFEKLNSTAWICAVLGFTVIFLSIILALLPSNTIVNKGLFYIKTIGGSIAFIGIGLLFYYRKTI